MGHALMAAHRLCTAHRNTQHGGVASGRRFCTLHTAVLALARPERAHRVFLRGILGTHRAPLPPAEFSLDCEGDEWKTTTSVPLWRRHLSLARGPHENDFL